MDVSTSNCPLSSIHIQGQSSFAVLVQRMIEPPSADAIAETCGCDGLHSARSSFLRMIALDKPIIIIPVDVLYLVPCVARICASITNITDSLSKGQATHATSTTWPANPGSGRGKGKIP